MGHIILVIFGLYLFFQIIMGYRRGFIKALLMLAAWILTFTIAYYYAGYFQEPVKQFLIQRQQNIFTDQIAYVISFILVAIVLKIVFAIIIGIINKINDLPGIGFINKVAGAILGMTKGCLVIALVLFLISWMPYIGMESTYNQIKSDNQTMEYMVENNPFQKMISDQKN